MVINELILIIIFLNIFFIINILENDRKNRNKINFFIQNLHLKT